MGVGAELPTTSPAEPAPCSEKGNGKMLLNVLLQSYDVNLQCYNILYTVIMYFFNIVMYFYNVMIQFHCLCFNCYNELFSETRS